MAPPLSSCLAARRSSSAAWRGPFTGVLVIEAEVTERVEPTRVAFNLRCLNEPFEGGGVFLSEELLSSSTRLTFDLTVKALGMAAHIFEVLSPPVIARSAKSFV